MRIRTQILLNLTFALLIVMLSGVTCNAFEGHTSSKDGNLVVTWKVDNGYKNTVRIDTRRKKSAYLKYSEGDVVAIKVDFVEVNGDDLQDVIIKYTDETGYSPAVLVNNDNFSFAEALSVSKSGVKEPLYINTELEIKEGGRATRRGGYKLKNRDGIPEIVFYNAFIGSKGYHYAAFRYHKSTMSYVLYKKGELFEEH